MKFVLEVIFKPLVFYCVNSAALFFITCFFTLLPRDTSSGLNLNLPTEQYAQVGVSLKRATA